MKSIRLMVVCVVVLSVRIALAQWITQTVTLKPGWNAVHLQVKPVPAQCDAAFAGIPGVESVWKFNRRFTTIEFEENPGALLPDPDHWLFWLPRSHPDSFLRTMVELQGGQAYLIKVAANAGTVRWQVKGMPAGAPAIWVPNSVNLVGLRVDDSAPPSFAQFFSDIPQVSSFPGVGSGIYGIGYDGREYQVRQTERTLVQPGVAYWIKLNQYVRWTEPLAIEGEYADSGKIDFGRERSEAILYLRNPAVGNPIQLTLRVLPSEPAPSGYPEVAGPVPLGYFVSDIAGGQFGWQTMPDSLVLSMTAGEQKELRLGVLRSKLAHYTPAGTNGAAYQSLIEVRESPHQFRLLIPVKAESELVRSARLQSLATQGDGDLIGTPLKLLPLYDPGQGLWVGKVTINKVSMPGFIPTDPPDPGHLWSVSKPMSTRLILHVNTNGQAQLLQRVIVAWGGPATNGQYALYSDESQVPRTGTETYRLSTVTLPVMEPRPMQGTWGMQLTGRVDLGYDDPVNPFRHVFHPDHDNLDELFSTNKLPVGVESFNIRRDISLVFAEVHRDATGNFLPLAPVIELNGTNQFLNMGSVELDTPFSIRLWLKVDAPTANTDAHIFYFGGDSPTNAHVALRFDGATGRMQFEVRTNSTESAVIATTDAFPSNQWVQVTVVHDSAQGSIYWNESLKASGPAPRFLELTFTNGYFGKGPLDSGATFLRGHMHDMLISEEVFSANQVAESMSIPFHPDNDQLLAYFEAHEGEGTTVSDVTGHRPAATLEGGARWDRSEVAASPFWGQGHTEGRYLEKIQGLRTQPVAVEGTFQLDRISRDGVLR